MKMRGMSPQQARLRRIWAEMAMQDAKAAEQKRARRKLIAVIALSVIFIVVGLMGILGMLVNP